MQKIHIIIGKELQEVDGEFYRAELDVLHRKEISGKIHNYPQAGILSLLRPCKEGRVYTKVDNKSYKITELESDGTFRAEPDF